MTHRSEANCATATVQIASDRTTACQLGLVLQGIPIISTQWGWMVDAYMAWSSAYGSLAVIEDSSASALREKNPKASNCHRHCTHHSALGQELRKPSCPGLLAPKPHLAIVNGHCREIAHFMVLVELQKIYHSIANIRSRQAVLRLQTWVIPPFQAL